MRGLAPVYALLVPFGVWAAGAAAAEDSPADQFANAVESADLNAVKALVEGGHPVDTPIAYVEKDATPLYKAAGEGRTEIVRYLIAHGANVNYRGSEWGHTPLSEAAERGFDDVIDILLKAGADPKVKDRNGYTAFAIAVLGGQNDVAEALLKYGDVNGADNFGNTVLMAATTTGQVEAIRWLVGKGADVNKVSQLEYGGRTALVDAAEGGSRGVRADAAGAGGQPPPEDEGREHRPVPRPAGPEPERGADRDDPGCPGQDTGSEAQTRRGQDRTQAPGSAGGQALESPVPGVGSARRLGVRSPFATKTRRICTARRPQPLLG